MISRHIHNNQIYNHLRYTIDLHSHYTVSLINHLLIISIDLAYHCLEVSEEASSFSSPLRLNASP